MNKNIIHYLVTTLVTTFCVPFAAAYTNSECIMAKDLGDNGIIYKESECRDYNLDRTIYRQEVAALALRVAEKCGVIDDIPEINDYDCDNIFYDVTSTRPNSWVCRSVEILADNNIITTSRRDTFGRAFFQPMKDITKSEALSMIMDSAGFEFRGERYDDWRFTNTGAVNWQKPVMQYAEDNNIIPSISSFRPNVVAYRREVFAYAQKSIEHCEDLDGDNDNDSDNNDGDNFYITTDDASPDTDDWVDLTIRARDGSSTDTGYRGGVEFDVYYRSGSSSSWIKTTSSSYYEIDEDYEDGYTFTSSNDGQKTLTNFIRFRKDDYQYKVVVTDEDDGDIEGYKIFYVGDAGNDDNNNEDTDNFYITTDDASPDTDDWVDLTIRARDGSSTDTGYRGGVEFDVYYRSGSSSSWIKTTSSSYYEIDEDYEDGYTFTSSNDGQKTLTNFIRFRKDDYQYKVVVTDEDDGDIEGYKIFYVGDAGNDECGFGEYESGGNCYACTGRPSNGYYEEEGSCEWTCNTGYAERNGVCEYDNQTCGVGQYANGNNCYNCTIKPSSANYTSHGTCDWSCNSGYYREGNTCVSNTLNCGVGQMANGNTCQSCASAPSNSYYTTAGSCSWACNANYYASGNQCIPYTQNCGVGQYLNGSVCVNCTGKPGNSLYSQSGTCDWVCDYGYTRDGNSCTPTQNYSWYTGNWNTCNTSCGGGTQNRIVECRSNIGYVVNDWQCTSTKPVTNQSCNTQACENYSWSTGSWGTCTNGAQTRTVVCKNSNNVTVGDAYCGGTKPTTTQSCSSWSYDWKIGNWGTCQNNVQDRTVLCERNDGNIVSNTYCDAGTKPVTSQSCNTMTYSWVSGSWGTCTNGAQTRTVVCKNSNNVTVGDAYCGGTKPTTTRNCTTYSWYRGDSNTCGDTCNTTREVVCKNSSGQVVADSYCTTSKPSHVCSRALAWVDTDSTRSCNTVCNQRNSCWVEDSQAQACASGERIPTWGTFNFLFGRIANPTQLGGFYIYERENRFYCYGKTQTRDYAATDKVVSCLCQ